jgi:two-component system, chemotaxis family, protein-glutamate methylesterase/glutaminase
MKRIKVLIVDDSALIRKVLTELIGRQPDMEVVGAAPDPLVAREMIKALNPDVLTLDVEMPRMDGLDFLQRLMRLRPMPVVMVSTLTEEGADTTLRALELGAIDFVSKPKLGVADGMKLLTKELGEKIRVAAQARVHQLRPIIAPTPTATAVPSAARRPGSLQRLSTEKILFIGASTGGTEATKVLLMGLPPDAPAVMVTQHMPPGFTKSYAARLDSLCRISVKEAVDGERALPGHAYIAPGGKHLTVERSGANYVTRVQDGDPVNHHRPSVDVLFNSAARVVGPNALGVMLTGMGADGAIGMRAMRDAGSFNVAQDEESCVVFGMPREAIANDAVQAVLPLTDIADCLLANLRGAGAALNRI